MTSAKTTGGVPATPDSPVTLDCLHGVGRARGHIAARRRPSCCETLIHTHAGAHQPRDRAHRRSPSRALRSGRRSVAIVVRSVACDQSSIGAVIRIRWSPPGKPGEWRSRSTRIARRRRLVRFLTTAEPTERGIANANRASSSSSGRTTSRIGPRPRRSPSARRRSKARRPESRPITPRGGRGPSGDGHAERRGRRGCSSGTGSRASWHACERWADTGAS